MRSYFCLSVTLLDAAFHGRRDDGVPEWPPSPLRAFQALVAAAAARWHEPQFSTYAAPALQWLEGLDPPHIIAPVGRTAAQPFRLYVPNNAGDLVAKAWAGGNADASIAEHRTEKDVRPTRIVGGDVFKEGANMVRFLWRIPAAPSGAVDEFITRLSAAARSVTHLGWGIDMTAGHAARVDDQAVAAATAGRQTERWIPGFGDTPLRVPQAESGQGPSTFKGLIRRHGAFTRRMADGEPQDVPPLTVFNVVGYRRAIEPPQRPFAAFSILQLDGSGFRSYDPVRRSATVAGMVRHALAQAAEAAGWPRGRVNEVIHGHTADGNGPAQSSPDRPRFTYVPLPSIERRGPGDGHWAEHVGGIRRVLVVGSPGMDKEVAWVRRVLSGQELLDERTKQPAALVSMIPQSDARVQRYTKPSDVWNTVTPLILPGYDDPAHLRRRLSQPRDGGDNAQQKRLLGRLGQRIEDLLRKALGHAGYSETLIENAELEWRKVGFLPGVAQADQYGPNVPLKLRKFSRCHVRIRWRDADGRAVSIPGPVIIGGGRFCGFGLFLPAAD